MDNENKQVLLIIIILILASLACGSVEVGIVTPTNENDPVNLLDLQEPTPEVVIIDNSQPTEEPQEDFSHLWVEYWNPVFNYGLAIPCPLASGYRIARRLHDAVEL